MEVLTRPRTSEKKEEMEGRKVVLLLSGGVDSTTLLYDLVVKGYDVNPIAFIYGQKHKIEVSYALASCAKLGPPLEVVKLDALGNLAPSALTRVAMEVPKVGYDKESMKQTVVPNRNMVLIALATSYAIGIKADKVFYAAHGGDHTLYPDCRPAFLIALAKAIKLCDFTQVDLDAPYLYWSKEDIIRRGIDLKVDYSLAWSCYEGGIKPCQKCGTCIERAEAFRKVGVSDPLLYKED